MNIQMLSDLNAFNQMAGIDSLGFAWMIVKWMVAFGIVIYTVFAAVVIKQVSIMAETVEDPANGIVRLFAWAHLVLSVVILALVIMIL